MKVPGLSFFFPIRFKFLVTLLLVVTSAIGVITVTMTRLFHTDKTAYIHDLTSTIALHTAEETRVLLGSYREKLLVFSRLMEEEGIEPARKEQMLKKLFQDFQEFVLVAEYQGEVRKNTVYDARAIEGAGISRQELLDYHRTHPLPLERIRKGEVYVDNSTLSPRLPVMTLAVAEPAQPGAKPHVVVALVRLDGLITLAGQSKVFEVFVLDREGALLGHRSAQKVAQHLKPAGLEYLKQLARKGSLGATTEYGREGHEMVAGFAPVDLGGLLSVVEIPKATAYLTAKELLNSLLGVALLLLISSALLSFFWSRRLTRPIEELSTAAQVVGHGNFDIELKPNSRDEIGNLANSFNQMTSELKDRDAALKLAQEQLVQSEKMSAFGQLSAGIAHEVKNPLAGILGYVQLSMRKLEKDSPLHNNLQIIEKETKRCRLIIDNLMKFARQEKVAHMPTDVNVVVEEAAAIVDHQLGVHQVRLRKELSPALPAILGNGNHIEQVLINLMINAQQAMDGPGNIELRTALTDAGAVEISVKDDGPGIPKPIQAKIFEPFFTTKASGKGTGLGLSVSYGIIKEHKGEIRVESEPGEGTMFVITLPVAAGAEQEQEPPAANGESAAGAELELPAGQW